MISSAVLYPVMQRIVDTAVSNSGIHDGGGASPPSVETPVMEPAYIDDAPTIEIPPVAAPLKPRRRRIAREFEAVLGQLYVWVMAEPVPPRLLAILRGTSMEKLNNLTQPGGPVAVNDLRHCQAGELND